MFLGIRSIRPLIAAAVAAVLAVGIGIGAYFLLRQTASQGDSLALHIKGENVAVFARTTDLKQLQSVFDAVGGLVPLSAPPSALTMSGREYEVAFVPRNGKAGWILYVLPQNTQDKSHILYGDHDLSSLIKGEADTFPVLADTNEYRSMPAHPDGGSAFINLQLLQPLLPANSFSSADRLAMAALSPYSHISASWSGSGKAGRLQFRRQNVARPSISLKDSIGAASEHPLLVLGDSFPLRHVQEMDAALTQSSPGLAAGLRGVVLALWKNSLGTDAAAQPVLTALLSNPVRLEAAQTPSGAIGLLLEGTVAGTLTFPRPAVIQVRTQVFSEADQRTDLVYKGSGSIQTGVVNGWTTDDMEFPGGQLVMARKGDQYILSTDESLLNRRLSAALKPLLNTDPLSQKQVEMVLDAGNIPALLGHSFDFLLRGPHLLPWSLIGMDRLSVRVQGTGRMDTLQWEKN